MKCKFDEVVKSQKSDGTVKSSRCKARKSEGMRRTYLCAAMTEDAAPVCVQGTGREPRRWIFYEAVKEGVSLCQELEYLSVTAVSISQAR